MNRREMLLENFKFIFSFLVRTCSPSELEKALGYVQVNFNVSKFFLVTEVGLEVGAVGQAWNMENIALLGKVYSIC